MQYDLVWDLGTSGQIWESYNSQLTSIVGESFIYATITGLSSGYIYQFKYRALNIHGWSSEYSNTTSVQTIIQPAQIISVTTIVVKNNVLISWIKPYSGGVGISIISYTIQIKRKDGIFVTAAECNGTNTTIIQNNQCTISMQTLTGPSFNLTLGDLIVA